MVNMVKVRVIGSSEVREVTFEQAKEIVEKTMEIDVNLYTNSEQAAPDTVGGERAQEAK